MNSDFWRVKPQLHTKLSTSIVDSQKNALRIDHLKKLLRNHIKTFAQLGNRIAVSTLSPILHLLTRELRIPNSLPQRTTRPAEAPALGQTPGVVCRGVVA